MSEHNELVSYKHVTDLPSSAIYLTTDRDGRFRAGFRCPYCGESYASDASAGSYDENSERLSGRMKLGAHANNCRGYLKILKYRQRIASDPLFAREEEIRYYFQTGKHDELPPELAEDVKKFKEKYGLG